MLPAAEKFVVEMRQACASGLEGRARWERCRELLKELIADPDLKLQAQTWPVGGFDGRKVDNLLFYEDPDYGFAMNALIKNPGGRAMIHDHGTAWTIYGVVQGQERIVRFAAKDNGDGTVALEETQASICGPGDVDIVEPREIPGRSIVGRDPRTDAAVVGRAGWVSRGARSWCGHRGRGRGRGRRSGRCPGRC